MNSANIRGALRTPKPVKKEGGEYTVEEKKPRATDILVETGNPEALDRTMQSFGAAVVGGGMPSGYVIVEGYYVVRVFSNVGFVKFAIENQGYGKVIRELAELV